MFVCVASIFQLSGYFENFMVNGGGGVDPMEGKTGVNRKMRRPLQDGIGSSWIELGLTGLNPATIAVELGLAIGDLS